MRRSTFIGWLAFVGVVAREWVSGTHAMPASSSAAQASPRETLAAVWRAGRCYSSRTTSRWFGYTRADLV